MRLNLLVIIFAVMLFTVGCGQKGPLYRPDSPDAPGETEDEERDA